MAVDVSFRGRAEMCRRTRTVAADGEGPDAGARERPARPRCDRGSARGRGEETEAECERHDVS